MKANAIGRRPANYVLGLVQGNAFPWRIDPPGTLNHNIHNCFFFLGWGEWQA